MLKIFLSSHGHFATGIKSSLDILLGNSGNIYFYDAYVDESSLSDNLDSFFRTVEDHEQVLLLSDLYGGSVNQVMYTYLQRPNTYLVAGVNLSFVLEVAMKSSVDDELLHEIVEQSRRMLRVVNNDQNEDVEEDFF